MLCPAGVGEQVVSFETFENSDASSWTNGIVNTDSPITLTHYLGMYGNNVANPSRTYTIPAGASSIVFSFDMLELGEWDGGLFDDNDGFTFVFTGSGGDGSLYTELRNSNGNAETVTGTIGSLAPTTPVPYQRVAQAMSGPSGDAQFNHQVHTMTFEIPAVYFDGTNSLQVEIQEGLNVGDITNESMGVDNVQLSACFEVPSMVPSVSPSIRPSMVPSVSPSTSFSPSISPATLCPAGRTEQVVSFETFENNDASSWTNGIVNTDSPVTLTHYLGMYGNNVANPSRTYTIPAGASSIVFSFDMLELGEWDGGLFDDNDGFTFVFTGSGGDGSLYTELRNSNGNAETVTGTIGSLAPTTPVPYQRVAQAMSGPSGDAQFDHQVHTMTFEIPAAYFDGTNSLQVEIQEGLNTGDITNESIGVDNVQLSACF